MAERKLPRDLERLERLLACGPRPEPSAALRQRVLGGVQSELHREDVLLRWRCATALAATVLLALGLSLAAVQTTAFALQPRRSPPSVHEVARRLRQLSPDLSPAESVREATLLQIGAEVGCRTKLGDQLGLGNAP